MRENVFTGDGTFFQFPSSIESVIKNMKRFESQSVMTAVLTFAAMKWLSSEAGDFIFTRISIKTVGKLRS